MKIHPGDNITLVCNTEGSFGKSFTWIRNSSIISNSEALQITNIQLTDGGEYICKVATDSIVKIEIVQILVTCKGFTFFLVHI